MQTGYTSLIARHVRRLGRAAGLLAVAGVTACDTNLNLTNPNSPTEQTALSTVDGVIATSLGMQDQLASSILTYVRAPALVTDEWGPASRALGADQSLFTGEGIDPAYGVVSGPYYVTYRIARTADVIIAAVPSLPGLGTGFAAGLTANAKLFKAMALGYAAMQYEKLPLGPAIEGAVPVPRAQVFAEVIALLESARADLANVTDAQLAGFTSRALTPGFNVRNTIDAMLARYYLYTDQYALADAAAARVNLSVVSELTYSLAERNPIYAYSTDLIYVAPLRSFATEAEAGDKRVDFWVNRTGTPPQGTPPTLQLLPFQKYGNMTDPFPVYLPGEMLLIRAEAAARRNDLATAVSFINQVRTKSGTARTPGAELPPLTVATLNTQARVLAQIAYERRYELFSQGLRWEDLRRLGQYVGETPAANFLPFPDAECTSNPNAGC